MPRACHPVKTESRHPQPPTTSPAAITAIPSIDVGIYAPNQATHDDENEATPTSDIPQHSISFIDPMKMRLLNDPARRRPDAAGGRSVARAS